MSDALRAELEIAGRRGLEAYLQGCLRDGTRSVRHGTHRIGQADRAWLELLRALLQELGERGWIYREGLSRRFWIVETTAGFLSLDFDASPLAGTVEGLHYVRGYFDAEGGMPRAAEARLYLQFGQKDRTSLEIVRRILLSHGIRSGRLHNPSRRIDPDYWRFFVRAGSHEDFMTLVGSWHPRKRRQIETRLRLAPTR